MFLQQPIIESIIICFPLKERFVVCALVCKAWRKVVADQYRYPLTWRLVARRLQNWFWFRQAWRTQESFHIARLIKPLPYSGVASTVISVYAYFENDIVVLPIEHVGLVYAFGCENSPQSESDQSESGENDTATHITTSANLKGLFCSLEANLPKYSFFEHRKVKWVADCLPYLPLNSTFSGFRVETAFKDVVLNANTNLSRGLLYQKFLSVGLHISLDTSQINNVRPWTITSHSLGWPRRRVMRFDFYCYALCELSTMHTYSDICGGALYFDWLLRHKNQVQRYLETVKRRHSNRRSDGLDFQNLISWVKYQVGRTE